MTSGHAIAALVVAIASVATRAEPIEAERVSRREGEGGPAPPVGGGLTDVAEPPSWKPQKA